MTSFGLILLLVVSLTIYILPAIIANRRKHHNENAIAVFNLLLGWTLLGWIAALVWSLTTTQSSSSGANTKSDINAKKPEIRSPTHYSGIKKDKICPHCDRPISTTVSQCHECGAIIGWSRASGTGVLTPSVTRIPEPSKIAPEQIEDKVCPDCAETIKFAAKVCRYCGYRFEDG